MNHPDVVPYARFLNIGSEEKQAIEDHLRGCGECRDLVLFVRKTNATLQREGRISKIAQALRVTVPELKRHIEVGTSVSDLIEKAVKPPTTIFRQTSDTHAKRRTQDLPGTRRRHRRR